MKASPTFTVTTEYTLPGFIERVFNDNGVKLVLDYPEDFDPKMRRNVLINRVEQSADEILEGLEKEFTAEPEAQRPIPFFPPKELLDKAFRMVTEQSREDTITVEITPETVSIRDMSDSSGTVYVITRTQWTDAYQEWDHDPYNYLINEKKPTQSTTDTGNTPTLDINKLIHEYCTLALKHPVNDPILKFTFPKARFIHQPNRLDPLYIAVIQATERFLSKPSHSPEPVFRDPSTKYGTIQEGFSNKGAYEVVIIVDNEPDSFTVFRISYSDMESIGISPPFP